MKLQGERVLNVRAGIDCGLKKRVDASALPREQEVDLQDEL